MHLSAALLHLTLIAIAIGLTSCQTSPTETPLDPKQAQSAKLFKDTVSSVFEHRCIHCHHNEVANSGLNFQKRATVFQSGGPGPFIIPGQPDQSRVWQAIHRPNQHPSVMPGDGWGLTEAHKAAILKWIETGAYWPEGKAGQLKIKKYNVELDDYL